MDGKKPVFLMSPPRHDWQLRGRANKRSVDAVVVNARSARDEWARVADAIVEAGGDVVVLPPDPARNLTGMIYTAEAGEYYEDGEYDRFILPNMATEHRRDEASWIGGFVQGLGFRTQTVSIAWEAQGDAIRDRRGGIVHTFGSGRYRRTESRAYGEVAHLLSERHMQVHFHADPWFHGNTFLGIFEGPQQPQRLAESAGRRQQVVLVNPRALLPGEYQRLKQFMPEARYVELTPRECFEGDTNSIQVGKTIIAVDSLTSKSEEALRGVGLEIVKLELAELFGKGGGAPACLTNRLWGIDPQRLPVRALWSQNPGINAHTDV